MSFGDVRGINVIMQVYRGDSFWNATLDSLAGVRHLFDTVVMSFDGPTRDELVRKLDAGEMSDVADHLLVSPKVMTAAEHLVWWPDQDPVSDWNDNQLVMLLSEDDLLCSESLAVGLDKVKSLDNSILFGSWQVHQPAYVQTDRDANINAKRLEIFREHQIAKQLNRWVSQSEVTTISGITLEMRALRSYIRQVRGREIGFPLLSGVRTEYFLATQPQIRHLIRCTEPIASIQIHAQQEGTILDQQKKDRDEALYQFWLCITPQRVGTTSRSLAFLRLIKNLTKKPETLLALPSAWLAFRGARDAT